MGRWTGGDPGRQERGDHQNEAEEGYGVQPQANADHDEKEREDEEVPVQLSGLTDRILVLSVEKVGRLRFEFGG